MIAIVINVLNAPFIVVLDVRTIDKQAMKVIAFIDVSEPLAILTVLKNDELFFA